MTNETRLILGVVLIVGSGVTGWFLDVGCKIKIPVLYFMLGAWCHLIAGILIGGKSK